MGRKVMLKLADLLVYQQCRVAKERRIQRTIESESFRYAYYNCNDQQREEVDELVKNGDENALKEWSKKHSRPKLEYRSYRELREMGKRLRIPRWSRLEKDDLISEIRQKGYKG